MKKLFLLFVFLIGCLSVSEVNAQTYTYKGFQAAYKYVQNGRWTDWTDWITVNVLITIDYDNDIIKVYANEMQTYVIYEYDGSFTDNSGGQQIQFSVIDQDYDKGKVRLRIEKNGNSQLYVDFADVTFVWNVRKI